METTVEFKINEIGDDTGNPYTGTFKVKTLLDRRDRFVADERRRGIIGANAADALVSLQEEAFILGQLFVRVVDGPKWWKDSNGGLSLEDGNVIVKVYELTLAEEVKRKEKIREEAKQAVRKLSKE
jgi:hypothetical protein